MPLHTLMSFSRSGPQLIRPLALRQRSFQLFPPPLLLALLLLFILLCKPPPAFLPDILLVSPWRRRSRARRRSPAAFRGWRSAEVSARQSSPRGRCAALPRPPWGSDIVSFPRRGAVLSASSAGGRRSRVIPSLSGWGGGSTTSSRRGDTWGSRTRSRSINGPRGTQGRCPGPATTSGGDISISSPGRRGHGIFPTAGPHGRCD
jgi:hypothetical protein